MSEFVPTILVSFSHFPAFFPLAGSISPSLTALAPLLIKEGNPLENIFTRRPLYTRPRLSTREFRFDSAQKVGFWPLFRVRFAFFALKNQFVLCTSKTLSPLFAIDD